MSVSNTIYLAIAASYAFIIVFGAIPNIIVALTYLRWYRTMLSQPKDILILSLAIGDFFMSALVCPLGFISAVAKQWIFGHPGCVWYGFFSTWIGLASISQLAALAVERYVTLSNPSPNPISLRRACHVVLASWSFALIASCSPLLRWSEYTFEGLGLHCSIQWEISSPRYVSYCVFLLTTFFLVPVLVIVYSYAKIFLTVRHIYLNAGTMWGADAQATKQSYTAQVKTAKQLLLIIAGYTFAWTPYALMSALILFSNVHVPLALREIPSLFAKTSLVYNPFIYFFTYRHLRQKAIQMVKGVANSVHPENASHAEEKT